MPAALRGGIVRRPLRPSLPGGTSASARRYSALVTERSGELAETGRAVRSLPVELRAHDDVQSFLDGAGALLLRDEARHNLIYGICTTLAENPDAYRTFHGWTLESHGEGVGAALM